MEKHVADAAGFDWSITIGAIQAVILAFLGFAFWRIQLIAQRRFAVAEEAIVAFMMASFALAWARNGASFEGEGVTRPRQENETEDERRQLDGYYTAIERLRASEQRFADLERISLLAHHHLGDDAYKAFETLGRARHKVTLSAGMLIRLARSSGAVSESTRALLERCEDDIWGGQLPQSRLTQEVADAEKTIRAICDREAQMTAAIWPFRFSSRRGQVGRGSDNARTPSG